MLEGKDFVALGDEDVEQPAVRGAGIAEPVRESCPDLRQRVASQPLVEDLRHPGHGVGCQGGRHPDKDCAHHAAPQVEHQQQSVRCDRHQFHPLQDDLVQRRCHSDAQFLGQHAQHLRRPPEQFLRCGGPAVQLAFQCQPVGSAEGAMHHPVDVGPVGPVGGDSPGRRVGMVQVTLVFQLTHDPAHRGRRHAEAVPPGDRLAARRLSRFHIKVDNGLQHAELAFGEGSW